MVLLIYCVCPDVLMVAIPIKTIEWFKKNLIDYCGEDSEKLRGVRQGNVVKLFESRGIDILESSTSV